MWLMLPTPEVANVYLPGLAFSSAMNSFRSFALIVGPTETMFGIDAMFVIGWKSARLYCGFGWAAGYTIIVLTVAMASV